MKFSKYWLAAAVLLLSDTLAYSDFVPGGGDFVPVTRQSLNVGVFADPFDYDPQCGPGGSATSTHDCAPATSTALGVQTATAGGTPVYVPVHIQAGNYTWLTAPTNSVQPGQCLYGDGKGETNININSSFSASPSYVLPLAAGTFQGYGPCVHDLSITFSTPVASTSVLTSCTISNGSGGAGTQVACTIASGTPANGNIINGTGITALTSLSSVNIVGSALTATASISQNATVANATTGAGRTNFVALGTCNNIATGCQYPWAIGGTGLTRPVIHDIRVAGAWDGIDLDGGSYGGAFLDKIEVGAFDIGLKATNQNNFFHVTSWDSWNYGICNNGANCTGSAGLLANVYDDGNTQAWNLGQVAGLEVKGLSTYVGSITINNSSTFGNIENLQLDTNAALIVTNASFLNITNGYSSNDAAITTPIVSVVAGTVTLVNFDLERGTASTPGLAVSGGLAQVIGGFTNGGVANTSDFTVSSSGKLILQDYQIRPNSLTDGTTPIIADTGGGNSGLVMTGDQITGTATNGNPAFSIANDNVNNFISNNFFNKYTASLPAGAFQSIVGYYDMGDVPFTLTLTPTFATEGDFSPTGVTTTGSYFWLRGYYVDFTFALTFTTNAYTTASGALQITTSMPTPLGGISQVPGCSFSQIGVVTLSAGWPFCRIQTGTNAIIGPSIMTTNAGSGNMTTTNVPASKSNVVLAGSGRYRVK